MIIDHDRKFIFVHVYRTGGSSIDRAFGGTTNGMPTHTKLEDVPNWQDYFSFGFVRNPWDRTLSSYNYAKTKGKINGTFADYVNGLEPGKKTHAQYNMVKNCSYIGRFEHLQEDFNEVCSIVGVDSFTLPHVWKTDHKHYSIYYNEDFKEQVYRHQSGDVDIFGYTFGSTATKNIGRLK